MKNFKLATKITAITILILAIGLVAVWGTDRSRNHISDERIRDQQAG